MIQARVFTAAVAAAIGAALAAGVAAHAGARGGDAAPEPGASRIAATAIVPAAAAAPPQAMRRTQVCAGLLARAASRRAQEREAIASTAERRGAGAQGEIVSIEIDWHASGASP